MWHMMKENVARQRRIVYMDESYIRKNYCRHEDSLYDTNDEKDLTTITHHKGQSYCFIASIFDADHSVLEFERTDAQKVGLLHDTLDIFEGGKKQTKDYPGIFNHAYFVVWRCKLLDAIKKQNMENTIIIMDNAKYHKQIPDDTPQMGWKKSKLLDECSKRGIQVPDKSIKTEIWKLLEPFVRNTLPIICAMAKSEGREVIFSPPHYSDMQRLRSCGQILKVKSAGNTPRRQPIRTFLFALRKHSHTSSHTQCKAVSTRPTSTLKACTSTFLTSTTTMKTNTATKMYTRATMMATIMSMTTSVMVKPTTNSKVIN